MMRKNNSGDCVNYSWMWIIDKSNKWNLRPVFDIYYSTSSLTSTQQPRNRIPAIIMKAHSHVCPPVQVPIDVDEFSNVMIYIASPPGIFRPLSLAVTYSSWSQHCIIAANWVHCAINCWVKNIVLLSHHLHTLFFRCLEPYLNRPSISLKK